MGLLVTNSQGVCVYVSLYVSENILLLFQYLKDIILIRVLFSLRPLKIICCFWEVSYRSGRCCSVGTCRFLCVLGLFLVTCSFPTVYLGVGFFILLKSLIVFSTLGNFAKVDTLNICLAPIFSFILELFHISLSDLESPFRSELCLFAESWITSPELSSG